MVVTFHKRALLSVLLLGLGQLSAPLYAENETVKIGIMLCQTGECSEWGNSSLRGIQLARDELNASGGVLGRPVELLIQDSGEGTNPTQAISALQHLRTIGQSKIVVGPTWSAAGMVLADMIALDKAMVAISPTLGVKEFNEAGENIFNLWPHDEDATRTLAQHAYDVGLRRMAIFSNQQPWVQTQAHVFSEEFQELGGQIVAFDEPLPKETDLRSNVLRAVRAKPEGVFYANLNTLDSTAKLLRQLHFPGKQFAILMDDTRIAAAKGALEGTVFARYAAPGSDFRNRFQNRYQEEPAIGADTGYDTIKVLAAAMQAAGSSEPKEFAAALRKTNMLGASGLIRFDAHGGVVKTPEIWVVRQGKMVVQR